jgi:pimeloyl-ACP methyl ester carboxylesterase
VTNTNNTAPGRYASVNGLSMYYEIQGEGQPLVLIHGGMVTIDFIFGQILPGLAASRQVIAVELQAHGHTADIDRPMSYEAMADDVAALIGQLGLGQVDVFGFSLGGGVAWQMAIRHPVVVRKLVVVSAPVQRDGWYPQVLAGMAAITPEMMAETPLKAAYLKGAPDPAGWSALVTKITQLLGQDYDWTREVEAIKSPVLIVVGDDDGLRLPHVVEMYGLLGGGKGNGGMGSGPPSQLAVLPGVNHLTILNRADLLLPIVIPFLDAPVPNAT